MMKLFNYKYYDTPEGEDLYKKVIVTSKYAAITGFAFGSFDVLMFSQPQGVLATTGRYMWYIGPLVGMATAFTVTSNVARNIRDKNDEFNYFLGGLAAGSVFGAWSKSITAAVPMAVMLGICGVIKKTAVDRDWIFIPTVPMAPKTIQSVRHDWTMTKDIEELKTWTTGTSN